MENIVDVDYREVTPLDDKDIGTLTAETNELYARAESVAAVSMMMLVEAGKRLRVIKERVGHGGWGDWIKENLNFSQKKATRLMNLAEKNEQEGGLFSNLSTLTNIEISKIWALLEAPEEVAEEVMEAEPIEDMTVKDLREELKRIKEENKALSDSGEEMRQTAKNLADRVTELKAKVEMERKRKEQAEAQAAEALDTSELEEKLAAAQQDLKDYRAKVKADQDKLKEKAEVEAKEAARKELDDKMAELNDKIQKAAAGARAEAAGEVEGLKNEVARLQKMSDPVTGIFKAHVDSMQQEFNACMKAVDQAAPENRDKWKAALKQVIRVMEGQL